MRIEDVVAKHQDQLLSLPNVIGVAPSVREGKDVILVLVTQKLPESSLQPAEIVPNTLDGYLVHVMEVGAISAQTEP